MRILVTGATGFVGRNFALRAARDGHQVVAWVRDPGRARQVLGASVELVTASGGDSALCAAVESAHAVVNLAGAPVARRWSAAVKSELVSSRVDLTRRLVNAMGASHRRPDVLVSASAVGWYGDRGDEELTESEPAADGFLSQLCADWEAAAAEARSLGVRVATMRIGVVLGRNGGALAKMLPLFRLGLGATLGGGRQRVPFVHMRDAVELLMHAVLSPRLSGPVNVTAPHPVTNRAFTRALARQVRRPAFLNAPAWALRLAMGPAADALLQSTAAVPSVALASGFRFAFPTIDEALSDLLTDTDSVQIEPARDPPDSEYLRRRPPRYVLRSAMTVPAPLHEVFAFFQRAENLGALTPPNMAFRILSPTPIEMQAGAEIDYQIKLGPVRMPWRTSIERWDPPQGFVDAQLRGPYASWFHEHRYEAVGNYTRVVDRVWYAPPLGPLGAVAHRLLIARQLRQIFSYRAAAMRLRFGELEASSEHHDPATPSRVA